jgi:4-amino-4-deoxy-L-arabinose transferase-like glycosyltransferase
MSETSRWRTAVGVLFGLGALQLVVGALIPLDPDETYYWDWSRRLALGYYDHPPAIAWLIRAGTLLFGNTSLGVRFFPVLANLGGALALIALARRLGDARAARDTALLLLSLPIVAVWLILATPDCPLFLANGLALYAVMRAIEAPPGSRAALGWWLGGGAALGLGLLSKLLAIILPFGILLALLLRADLRRRFAEPGPYLACVLATLIVLPSVIWNSSAPVAYQLHHGLGGTNHAPLHQELDFIVGQLGIGGGILFVLLSVAVARSFASDTLRFRRPAVLAIISAATWAVFALSALRHRVEANWPLPAYMPAVVLLALISQAAPWRAWLRVGIALGGAAVTLAYVEMVTPLSPSPEEMIRRGHGWDHVAERVSRVRDSTASASGKRVWVSGNTYQDASELAFHLPDHPDVFALNLESRKNQYSVWPQFRETAHPGDDLVFVLSNRPESPGPISDLRCCFEHVAAVDSTSPGAGRREVPRRRIWVLENWRGSWPQQ